MSPLPASVLRGVAVTGEPRLLRHPMPQAQKPAEPLKRVASALVDGDPATRRPGAAGGDLRRAAPEEAEHESVDRAAIEQLRRDAIREGGELGRRDGFAEGRELGFREGREQGFAKGLADGRQSGEDAVARQTLAGRQALGTLIERLEQIVERLPGQFQERFAARLRASEDDMVALCHAAICRLLGEKAAERDSIVHAVREAVAQCSTSTAQSAGSGQLAIHVHPQDLELLQSDPTLSDWLRQHGAGPIPWRADAGVRLGGCIVHGNQGSLDARLETQLAALQQILLTGRDHGAGPRGDGRHKATREGET